MKKLYFFAAALLVICAAVLPAVFAGCSPDDLGPGPIASPDASPAASAAPSPSTAPTPRPSASAAASAMPSESAVQSPTASQAADATQRTGSIEGFMEGGIVDPEDAPEVTALFAEGEEYAGMTIQSITYKLYEGRQAYYVILQGIGVEDRAFYVFADGSVIGADTIPGD